MAKCLNKEAGYCLKRARDVKGKVAAAGISQPAVGEHACGEGDSREHRATRGHCWGMEESSACTCGDSGVTVIHARVTSVRKLSNVRSCRASSTTAQRCSLCSAERRTAGVSTRPRKYVTVLWRDLPAL